MAKYKLSKKQQENDWKFIILALGLITVVAMILLVNNKLLSSSLSLSSSAAADGMCNGAKITCKKGCNKVCDSPPYTNCVKRKRSCNQSCLDQFNACKKAKGGGGQPAGPRTTGGPPTTEESRASKAGELDTNGSSAIDQIIRSLLKGARNVKINVNSGSTTTPTPK